MIIHANVWRNFDIKTLLIRNAPTGYESLWKELSNEPFKWQWFVALIYFISTYIHRILAVCGTCMNKLADYVWCTLGRRNAPLGYESLCRELSNEPFRWQWFVALSYFVSAYIHRILVVCWTCMKKLADSVWWALEILLAPLW